MRLTRLQESHQNTEKHMQYQTDSTINNNVGNTNYNGGGGGGGCLYGGSSSSYSGSEVAGAAALGAVGGMAVGSMITASAAQPSTTIVENNPYGYTPPPYGYAPPPAYGPPPVGTTVYVLPPGAYSADGQRTELHVRQRRLLQNLLQRQPGGVRRHQSLRLNRERLNQGRVRTERQRRRRRFQLIRTGYRQPRARRMLWGLLAALLCLLSLAIVSAAKADVAHNDSLLIPPQVDGKPVQVRVGTFSNQPDRRRRS